jgi:penicillin-binding protein-related factor A (putative recombinase)
MNDQKQLPHVDLPESKRFMGRELERIIGAANSYYAAKKVASVDKVPRWWAESNEWSYKNFGNAEAVARTRGGHYLKALNSMVDFGGTVKRKLPDGRVFGHSVYFDAKSTARPSLPLDMIEDHQIRFVVQKHLHGARAGFIFWFRKFNRFFFLNAVYVERVQTLSMIRRESRKSFSVAMCEENGREISYNVDRVLDWIPALFPTEDTPNNA